MSTIKRILAFIAVAVIWQICSMCTSPIFVPSPEAVLTSFYQLSTGGELPTALMYSFLRITTATLLAVTIAVPVGLCTYLYKPIDRIFVPVVEVVRFIPITAFYPILIMWFGLDETMKVSFLFLSMFVYMLPSTIQCIKEVRQDLIDTAVTIGMNKAQVVTKVILPASLPSIIQSFIMMYGIGWTYIVIAETINAKHGLGFIINVATARGRTDLVFVAIIVIILFSLIFDYASNHLVKKIFKWRFINDSVE